ncbi:hypothetical protein CK203_024096 [Vitis vinifera]|uniref:Uncharacterized protein n=1 Tax=Vitis vinifera TaxID=29760 RepID=A0A438IPW1_VITVI|nr:hypothetical protein CK203_024096 [Vitis vinifera]
MVQIMLKPQEKIIAKPGSTCYMSGSTQMENVYISKNEVGMWQWAFGKAAASVVLLNQGSGDGFVGTVAPSLAKIFPIDSAIRCGRAGQASMAFLVLDGREMMVDECKWSFQEENFKE